MNMMKCVPAITVGCLCFVAIEPVFSLENDKTPDARGLMLKAQAAVRAVKTVKYDIVIESKGWLAPYVPALTGNVMIGPTAEYDVGRYVAHVTMGASDSDEKTKLSIGCDGDQYYLVDTKSKMVYQDMDAAVLGSAGSGARRAIVQAFTSDEPFANELKSDHMEYAGTETVGHEKCHVVKIKGEDGRETAVSISIRDYIPRMHQTTIKNPAGEVGAFKIVVSNIEVNPKFPKDAFKVKVPAGFTKTDDFAP